MALSGRVVGEKHQQWRKKSSFAFINKGMMTQLSKIEKLYPREFEILKSNGKLTDEWQNVYEHCKTEAAAALVLSDLLNLSKEERDVLAKAAILHDWYKRKEREASINGAQEYNKAAKDSYNKLLELGVNIRIVDVAHSVGHTSLSDILTTSDFLKKLMHFIDDITYGSQIVELDKRIDELEKADRYKVLNESGRVLHNGKTYFEVQREVGHSIQKEVYKEIFQQKVGTTAMLVDMIRNKIVDYI